MMFISLVWLLGIEKYYSQIDTIGSGLPIGRLNNFSNDVRLKQHSSWNWQKGTVYQTIRYGDLLFVGPQSRASVQLSGNELLQINENTLITFEQQNLEPILSIIDGTIRLNIQNELKIKVGEEILTLNGKNAQIELRSLLSSKSRGQLRVLKGQLSFARGKKKPILFSENSTKGSLIDLGPKSETHQDPTIGQKNASMLIQKVQAKEKVVSLLPESEPEIPILAATPSNYVYYWKFEDLYNVKNSEIKTSPQFPQKVKLENVLAWTSTRNKGPKTFGTIDCPEHAIHEDFEELSSNHLLQTVCLGLNLWKVSYNKNQWSESKSFFVEAQFKKDLRMFFNERPAAIELNHSTETFAMTISTTEPPLGFIVQASQKLPFSTTDTEVNSKLEWLNSPHLELTYQKPGVYHYRFRLVNAQHQISEWSNPLTIYVQTARPKRPTNAFPLAHSRSKPLVDDSVKLDPKALFRAPALTPTNNDVSASLSPQVLNHSSVKIPSPQHGLHNYLYDKSHIDIQPMIWAMQSSAQLERGQPIIFATGLALRAIEWWKSLGVEGFFKSKVFGLSSSQADVSLHQAEVRVHKRWFTDFPFSLTRELQIGAFAGIENYANSNPLFTTQYNLFKIGNLIEFPWHSKWEAGGEFVYGLAKDGSNKFEVSGHMNYFWNRKLSLGVGYRVHLFQAVTESSSADGFLPYREGYTEGYSLMSYYF